ncbi:hypothetical protein MHY87_13200 [Microvirga sp. ACRRW]|uniref:hypothetical protein n=1 Tax=Microvirga sp. ACRRW TaxID=2918205 RepID=UPI001EF5640C|nr:hypothetical protein [Microvirga sp. ACRRW]MCG7393863.1 hypothetical protein [Microvirga sp. ACRRW]
MAVETPAEEAQAVAAPGAVTEVAASLAMAQARGEVREAAARTLVPLGAVRATQGQEVRVRVVQAREAPVRETLVLADPGTIIPERKTQEPKILEMATQGLAIRAPAPPAAAKVTTMVAAREVMVGEKAVTAADAMITEAAEAAMVEGKVTMVAVAAITVVAKVAMAVGEATTMAGAVIMVEDAVTLAAAKAATVAGEAVTAMVDTAVAEETTADALVMMVGAAIPEMAMEDRGLAANIF